MKAHIKILLCLFLGTAITGCHSSKFVGEGQTFGVSQANVSSMYAFKDPNITTLKIAERIGILPIENREEARKKVRCLNHIKDTKYYKLDPMTHSMPYLADGATKLLKTIGKKFQKKLKKNGYRAHRVIATSMLRTRADVASLRKVNGNAAKNSAHMYATTFDLSYTRFNRISTNGNPVNNDQMANFLGEVLLGLRKDGRCGVIFERNQHCFHIMSNK